MIIKTRIFEFVSGRYHNLAELAQVMEFSLGEISRVQAGERDIDQQFVVGAIKAFPKQRLDELFYIAPD